MKNTHPSLHRFVAFFGHLRKLLKVSRAKLKIRETCLGHAWGIMFPCMQIYAIYIYILYIYHIYRCIYIYVFLFTFAFISIVYIYIYILYLSNKYDMHFCTLIFSNIKFQSSLFAEGFWAPRNNTKAHHGRKRKPKGRRVCVKNCLDNP